MSRRIRAFFLDTWMERDRLAHHESTGDDSKSYDLRPFGMMVVASVVLTLLYYFADDNSLLEVSRALAEPGEESRWLAWSLSPNWTFYQRAFWLLLTLLGLVVVPTVVVMGTKQSLLVQGLRWRETHWPVIVIGLVVTTPPAIAAYELWGCPMPVLIADSPGGFLLAQGLAVAHVLAVEFFYRGVWLSQLEPAIGSHAVFAIAVPYTMFQYTRDTNSMAWAVIALGSAIVLGTLAQRTRSIWSGFFIHAGVVVAVNTWVTYGS